MKNNELVGYGLSAVIIAVLIYNTWQWLVGGLAIFGVVYLLNDINRNNRPPRGR